MIVVLLDWIYILFITFLTGYLFLNIAKKVIKRDINKTIAAYIVCGIVLVTVYAQFFSLFTGVEILANVILIIISIGTFICFRKDIVHLYKPVFSFERRYFNLLGLFFILLIAFYTSRGAFHVDTSMYHAQAIRWYEEYGVVKGLGNLQLHFAYNSAYFGFAALFSMGKIFSQPLHCTTGFIEVLMVLWAISVLKEFNIKKLHVTDCCAVAQLLYILVNITGSISPASDYPTMMFTIYLIARWAEEIEAENHKPDKYGWLCVLSAYVVSLKLSSGLVVMLSIYPIVLLVKKKDWKGIVEYLIMSLLVVCPYLIRNVIISGWLVYPFAAVDLFNVEWKIPVDELIHDSDQIKVWGRCVYDISLAKQGIREWMPIWWEAQERYGQMLILTDITAVGLVGLKFIHLLFNKKKLRWNMVLLHIVTISGAISWFLLAPFIRYGLAFLLTIPSLAIGNWLIKEKSSLYKLVSGAIVVMIFFFLSPYWNNYFTDDMVFLKQQIREPYYIVQKDYETSEMEEFDVDGLTVYSPLKGEVTGYKYFPSSTYDEMIRSCGLLGNTIEEGFCHK